MWSRIYPSILVLGTCFAAEQVPLLSNCLRLMSDYNLFFIVIIELQDTDTARVQCWNFHSILCQNDLDSDFSSRSKYRVPNKPCRVSGRLISEYSSGEYQHYWTGHPAYVALQAQRSHIPKLFSYQMSSLRTLFPFRMLIAAIAALDSCDPCARWWEAGKQPGSWSVYSKRAPDTLLHPLATYSWITQLKRVLLMIVQIMQANVERMLLETLK